MKAVSSDRPGEEVFRRAISYSVPQTALWEPLHGGRVNEVWRVSWPDQEIICKVYAPDTPTPLFRNDPKAEANILSLLAGTMLAPELWPSGVMPFIKDEETRILFYQNLPGKTWRASPAPVAALLTRLHAVPAPNWLPVKESGSQAITNETMAILAECPPAISAALIRMKPMRLVPATSEQVLLHGDPTPSNILSDATGLRLIDWQCPARGEPAEDHSIFLAPAMQLLCRGKPLSAEEIRLYLRHVPLNTAERVRDLAPWFHWRMAAYCLWKTTHGVPGYKSAMDAEIAALNQINVPTP